MTFICVFEKIDKRLLCFSPQTSIWRLLLVCFKTKVSVVIEVDSEIIKHTCKYSQTVYLQFMRLGFLGELNFLCSFLFPWFSRVFLNVSVPRVPSLVFFLLTLRTLLVSTVVTTTHTAQLHISIPVVDLTSKPPFLLSKCWFLLEDVSPQISGPENGWFPEATTLLLT